MGSLQFAIAGCGKIAPRHAAEAARQGKLAAVCDIIPERADALAKVFNCRAYYSLSGLLEAEKNLDIMAICTPNGLHAEHSIQSLRAGCHVLCEKPLSITVADAEKMIAASKECGKKLFVVKSTRYNPVIAGLKKLLEENKLGRIYSFQLNCFWNRPPPIMKIPGKARRWTEVPFLPSSVTISMHCSGYLVI
jgi:predicted dehydrogenase